MDQNEIELLRKCYRAMVRSRRLEEKTLELYQRGVIHGSLHSGIGHEAVSVGVCAALNDDDFIFPHHRGLGYFTFRGTDPKYILAEWFGKKTGLCGGKGGVTHSADAERYIMGINGIVGANLPIAMGLALAEKMKGTNRVVACCVGDGAINQGSFHESANLASLWSVPLIYVCENNLYGFSVPLEESSAVPELEKRADAYQIPGTAVDGMDFLAVRDAVAEAAARARAGDGPSFLNCKTYRYYGHSMSDKRLYRTKDEENGWLERDPIALAADRLSVAGALNEQMIREIDVEAGLEIENAVRFARESPAPGEEDLHRNVFVSVSGGVNVGSGL